MRWRIQGSDISDGNSVLLDVEAPSAVDAVTQAHDRNIIVAQVGRSLPGWRVRRALPILLFLSCIALITAVLILRNQLTTIRRSSAETGQDAQRAAESLQSAREESNALRARLTFLESSLTDRERQRDQSITGLTARLAAADDSLRAAQTAAADLNLSNKSASSKATQLTKQIDSLGRDLAAAETARRSFESAAAAEKSQRERTEQDLAQATARAAGAESRAAALDARLVDLTAQTSTAEASIAALKAQLAQSAATAAPAPVAAEPAPRRSLAISYDQALSYAALHLGKPTVEAAHDQFTITALAPDYANTFTMHTDKEHVFDAALQVCLAGDAPKTILAGNRATLAAYLAEFAPQWKSPDAWLAAAFKHAAGKGDNDQSVLLTDYYRITVTGNKTSQFTIRIEPAAPQP